MSTFSSDVIGLSNNIKADYTFDLLSHFSYPGGYVYPSLLSKKGFQFYLTLLYKMNANMFFKETEIVNGQVIKDIALEKQLDSQKEIIKGYVNGRPVKFIQSFKKHTSKRKTKNHKRKTQRTKRKSATKK
jgi:hypothetical protein